MSRTAAASPCSNPCTSSPRQGSGPDGVDQGHAGALVALVEPGEPDADGRGRSISSRASHLHDGVAHRVVGQPLQRDRDGRHGAEVPGEQVPPGGGVGLVAAARTDEQQLVTRLRGGHPRTGDAGCAVDDKSRVSSRVASSKARTV